jgi:hypothetical protein
VRLWFRRRDTSHVFTESAGGLGDRANAMCDLPLPKITARVILTATTRNSASVSLAAQAAVHDRNPLSALAPALSVIS